ncbi:hypothetical protein RJT34_23766 [Clitoria ternatea]|uniref:Uncharacterized protein n=1 Tax=Clitoria ternatea TaxID=43366 RepID=A0AAN9FSW8_CLITE
MIQGIVIEHKNFILLLQLIWIANESVIDDASGVVVFRFLNNIPVKAKRLAKGNLTFGKFVGNGRFGDSSSELLKGFWEPFGGTWVSIAPHGIW